VSLGVERGSEELTLLRSDMQEWFTDECDIYRITGSDDIYGGRPNTHGGTPTYANVPCLIESGAGQEQERLVAGGIIEIQTFTIFLPAQQDIAVGDHVVVRAQDDSTAHLHLHVRAVMAPETLDVETRVIATQVGQEPGAHA
jgi:hypothetical protein